MDHEKSLGRTTTFGLHAGKSRWCQWHMFIFLVVLKAVKFLGYDYKPIAVQRKPRMQMIPHAPQAHQSKPSVFLLLLTSLLLLLLSRALCLSGGLGSSSLWSVVLAHGLDNALLLLWLDDGDGVGQRLLRAGLSFWVRSAHDLDLDAEDTLAEEDVAGSEVDEVLGGLAGVDHEPVGELHALGTGSAKLAGDDHLATLGAALHDESEDTIAGSSDGQAVEELVPEGLALSDGGETTVLDLGGVEGDGVFGELEALLDEGGELTDPSSLLAENLLCVGGPDDDIGDGGSDADLDARVSLLSQFALEELVQLGVEDTIGHELSPLRAATGSGQYFWHFPARPEVSYIAAPGTPEDMIAVVVWGGEPAARGSMGVVDGGVDFGLESWNEKIIGFRFCVRFSGVWRMGGSLIDLEALYNGLGYKALNLYLDASGTKIFWPEAQTNVPRFVAQGQIVAHEHGSPKAGVFHLDEKLTLHRTQVYPAPRRQDYFGSLDMSPKLPSPC